MSNTAATHQRIRWRWGLGIAFAMTMISLFPQIHFIVSRGHEWHGANAISHPDEVAYSAYIASLMRGSPRRYDPYTGRGAETGESLFSVQLMPAYAIALPSRWLGISTATLFIILPGLCAFASSLALFWFLVLLIRDPRLSAGGVAVILCLGTLIARQGIIRHVAKLNFLIPLWLSQRVSPTSVYHLPFLRLYQPAVAFPLFFVLCAFVWQALTQLSGRRSALNAAAAGLTLGILIYSYFYLWTAAAAWLACLAALWLMFRRSDFKRLTAVFGIIMLVVLPLLIGYFVMLSHRAETVDRAQALVLTHRPDLFRLSEIVSFVVLLALTIGARRRMFQWRQPVVLFAASLALTVLVIFNQQVITGRSLQPIHYEWFIGNYVALAAVVLTATLWCRNQTSRVLTNRRVAVIAALVLVWGLGEVWLAASVSWDRNRGNDELRPMAQRLTSLAQAEAGTTATVLLSDLPLADRLPTDAPQTLLWAPRMLVFPGVSERENRERFFRQLYYLGYDEAKIWRELDKRDWNFYTGLFPYSRLDPAITGTPSSIMPEEFRAQIRDYLDYGGSFDRQRAASPTLSYVVVHTGDQFDFRNLDRWYQRDSGEQIGGFVLYRVKLR